jgi:Kef-type K+ transport system membrane component KefB
MALSEDELRRAVDEALEPERLRALHRWAWATAGRVAVALVALFALGLVLRVLFGMTLPWMFFAFMGALMAATAFAQPEGREHLCRE